MIMKTFFIAIAYMIITASISAEVRTAKEDFIIRNESGDEIKRGKYTLGERGEVVLYEIYDSKTGKLLHSEKPFYDDMGNIIMCRVYDQLGAMKMSVAFIAGKMIAYDEAGNELSEEQMMQRASSEFKRQYR